MIIRLGVLAELLAIIALIVGVSIPIAGTLALIAATPTSAIAIFKILKSDKTASGAIETAFLFLTWILLPCMLMQYANEGIGENVFRFIIAARVFAGASIWKHSSQWKRSSNVHVMDGTDTDQSIRQN